MRLARAYLLGCLPERSHEVEALVRDLLGDPSPFLRRHALMAMWPVWNADQIHDRAASVSTPGLWYDAKCLEYMAGQLNESDLLVQAENCGSSLIAAHSTLAMIRLADGRMADARRHFQACVDTDVRGWFDYAWARGFLALMDADRSSLNSRPNQVD